MEFNWFVWIRLILEEKFGDNHLLLSLCPGPTDYQTLITFSKPTHGSKTISDKWKYFKSDEK